MARPIADLADEESEYFFSRDYLCAVLEDGTVEIAGYYGTETDLLIPDALDGRIVTAIGDHTFVNFGSLVTVTIPDSVTSIDTYAFYRCSSLTSVSIPDGVTSIGDSAFFGCKSLTSIVIPHSVTGIGNKAFHGCLSLTLTVTPDSCAEQYCVDNSIPYTYPDAAD